MIKKVPTPKSSLLAKYTLLYQKKPRSRVFAPLAETYRKLGMQNEALKILREGLKNHPTYTLGYIVLAQVYFDQQNYELAYNTIRPFVLDNLENITLQKLFAQICINLGFLEEALQTFKYLLLLNPKDQYTAEQVKLLEDDLLVNEVENGNFVEKRHSAFDNNEDDWIQVDFNQRRADDKKNEENDWSMQDSSKELDPFLKFKKEIAQEQIKIEAPSIDDEYFLEEYDNDTDDVVEQKNETPIITHTLVDLYCKQGYIDKAIQVLESILELHPHDSATQRRLNELKSKPENNTGIKIQKVDQQIQVEDSGHLELSKLIDNKKENDKKLLLELTKKLELFANKVRFEATKKQLNL
jgi:pentatricopeptide repeat protein